MNLAQCLRVIFGALQSYMMSPSTPDIKGLAAREFVENLLVNLAHLQQTNGNEAASVFILKLIPHCDDFAKLLEILGNVEPEK